MDVKNAFNSLPWGVIRRALRRLQCPKWLYDIIDSYLSDRAFFYHRGDGSRVTKSVWRGVLQGSVLGPFLWLVTYDEVLRVGLPDNCKVIGFADDTWLMCGGSNLPALRCRSELACENLIARIRSLGLEVSEAKTEVIVFGGGGQASTSITIGGQVLNSSQSVRYLGLMLDPKWCFDAHLSWVAGKAEKIMGALRGLMHNLRGPRESRRQLYASVVRSVILYGAPVWAEDKILKSAKRMRPLVRVQRWLDQRTICAYRTVSGVTGGAYRSFPAYRHCG